MLGIRNGTLGVALQGNNQFSGQTAPAIRPGLECIDRVDIILN